MSGLLKHWFSTSSSSGLKSISTKPIKITTRDAAIITALTLVATLLMTWIYYVVTSETDRTYWPTVWQTILISMCAQYMYEYTGVNNMLAESSMRYAKGSSLSKYISRREALVYECYYKLSLVRPVNKRNFDLLVAVLSHQSICGNILDGYSKDRLYKKYPKYTEKIDLLLTIDAKNIPALGYISDNISRDMVYDILVNGFDDYVVEGDLLSSLKDEEKLLLRGRSYIKAQKN